jgi:hypothetical protein
MISSQDFFDFKFSMEGMENSFKQKSYKRKNYRQKGNDDHIRNSYDEITEIDDGQNPVFLLFEGGSGVYILSI